MGEMEISLQHVLGCTLSALRMASQPIMCSIPFLTAQISRQQNERVECTSSSLTCIVAPKLCDTTIFLRGVLFLMLGCTESEG